MTTARDPTQARLFDDNHSHDGASIELVLDGATTRDVAGSPVASLKANGWVSPAGLPTERIRICVSRPQAFINPAVLADHKRRTDAAWLEHALERLRRLASTRRELTVDDIWDEVALPVRDARAQMSALVRAAEREGLIERTSRTRASSRIRRPVRIWRSLTFDAK